jgi:hypothetical protein
MRPTTSDPTKTGDEAESLEAGLRQRIIGQEDAIRQVVETYQTYVSGMSSPGRPIANLIKPATGHTSAATSASTFSRYHMAYLLLPRSNRTPASANNAIHLYRDAADVHQLRKWMWCLP